LKRSIIKNFGELFYANGELDKKYIASVVFNDKAKLELLNSLTHPATIRDAEVWMKEQNSLYIIKEAALLFESGAHKTVDKVIGVHAPLSLRVKRTMKRDGITENEVMKRISRQMDEEKKMSLCDFVLINDEAQLLLPQVLDLHKKFSTAKTTL
jgi:dephospho-CoA kinase